MRQQISERVEGPALADGRATVLAPQPSLTALSASGKWRVLSMVCAAGEDPTTCTSLAALQGSHEPQPAHAGTLRHLGLTNCSSPSPPSG